MSWGRSKCYCFVLPVFLFLFLYPGLFVYFRNEKEIFLLNSTGTVFLNPISRTFHDSSDIVSAYHDNNVGKRQNMYKIENKRERALTLKVTRNRFVVEFPLFHHTYRVPAQGWPLRIFSAQTLQSTGRSRSVRLNLEEGNWCSGHRAGTVVFSTTCPSHPFMGRRIWVARSSVGIGEDEKQ